MYKQWFPLLFLSICLDPIFGFCFLDFCWYSRWNICFWSYYFWDSWLIYVLCSLDLWISCLCCDSVMVCGNSILNQWGSVFVLDFTYVSASIWVGIYVSGIVVSWIRGWFIVNVHWILILHDFISIRWWFVETVCWTNEVHVCVEYYLSFCRGSEFLPLICCVWWIISTVNICCMILR